MTRNGAVGTHEGSVRAARALEQAGRSFLSLKDVRAADRPGC